MNPLLCPLSFPIYATGKQALCTHAGGTKLRGKRKKKKIREDEDVRGGRGRGGGEEEEGETNRHTRGREKRSVSRHPRSEKQEMN